jgi:hypothetical protein
MEYVNGGEVRVTVTVCLQKNTNPVKPTAITTRTIDLFKKSAL